MASNIKIGPYILLDTLGVGSFGKVKRAVHSITGHTVAIKIINKNKVVNHDMFARVKREIQYLKLLRHPHIIKLYEVISTPTSIYMVIEYAGGELFNYIVENTRLSEDEARRFFQQIVCAIEYCHRHKIVHRDLKPENLLLDPSMNVKIADFGLSNIMTDGDFLKTSCGSPNYAAPEVISGKLYAGPEVDTKYLLTSMLVVDPLKRITIAEIRQNAWFNVGLPDYLKPLPQGSTEDAFCDLQEDIIEELMKKMNFNKETIVQALEERQNNQIKVAYQLVVDHRRMIENASQVSPQESFQGFLATSPPPWNGSDKDGSPNKSTTGSSGGSALKSGLEGDTSDDSNDSPVPSSISVLSTSLPGNSFAKELHRKASLKNTRRDRTSGQFKSSHQQQQQQQHPEYTTTAAFHQAAVLGNSSLGGGIPLPAGTRTSGTGVTGAAAGSGAAGSGSGTGAGSGSGSGSSGTAAAAAAAAAQRRIKARPKWYFGIRSRSAPREVMAEIYRALSNLRMKWKIINAYHLRAKYEYAEGFEVKIELQLYRLDHENYLVDFKFVGQQSAAEMEAHAEFMRNLNEEAQALQAAQAAQVAQAHQGQAQDQDQETRHLTFVTPELATTSQESLSSPGGTTEATGSDLTDVTEPSTDPSSTAADDDDNNNNDVALAQGGAAHIKSEPQDIPQPDSAAGAGVGGHHGMMDLTAEHPLASTAPAPLARRHLPPHVSFQPVTAAADGLASSSVSTTMSGVLGTPSMRALSPMAALASTSLPAAGIMGSSLKQDQQYLQGLNELRQELKHQQRQRDLKQRPTHLLFPKASYQLASTKDVTSPFPFFDVCGKLITELAIGSG
ncbi:Protein kinase [Mortierella sp. GBA43]|nr:Protein kinase [Mortierella sp. GBA43]